MRGVFLSCLIKCCTVSADPLLFINQQQGDTVSVYDAGKMTPAGRIQVLSGPVGIAFNHTHKWAAVSYPDRGLLSFIDSERFVPLEHLSVEGSPFGIALTDDKLFYTDRDGGFVGVVDPVNSRILGKIAVGKSPAGIVSVKCRGILLVANRQSHSVTVLDALSQRRIKDIGVGEAPFVIDYDDRFAYVVNVRGNSLSVIDMNTMQEIRRLATGRMPYGVAVDRAHRKVYVANRLDNNISVFDSRTWGRVAYLKSGEYPENIALDEDGGYLYILNEAGSDLRVFGIEQNREVTRIELEQGSRSFGRFITRAPEQCSNSSPVTGRPGNRLSE